MKKWLYIDTATKLLLVDEDGAIEDEEDANNWEFHQLSKSKLSKDDRWLREWTLSVEAIFFFVFAM